MNLSPAERAVLVRRAGAGLALALALVIVGILAFGGSSTYTVHARFVDAGQLVNGGSVEIGGVTVGKIGTTLRIRLQEHYTVSVSESPISDRAAPTKH